MYVHSLHMRIVVPMCAIHVSFDYVISVGAGKLLRWFEYSSIHLKLNINHNKRLLFTVMSGLMKLIYSILYFG